MIRNKLIWGFFALVVAVSFVLAGYYTSDQGKGQGRGEGKLFNQDIPRDEFSRTRFFTLGMRPTPDLSAEELAQVRSKTWKRIAILKTAEKMGVTTSDEEIRQMLEKDPNFLDKNGMFDSELYSRIVTSQLKVETVVFEEFLRQEMTMQKVLNSLEPAIWCPPSEIAQKLKNLTDLFIVEYAELKISNVVGDVELTDEQERKYFQDNKQFFQVPEQINVRYVAFPMTNYMASVSIKDEQIS